MGALFPFDNSYARLPERLWAKAVPTPVRAPALLALNEGLARDLGLDPAALGSEAGIEVLAGNALPEGAEPIAQAYAGHQFGGFVPSLGDGRAILLGEITDSAGQRRDIQLKGAGVTPFSRFPDGRAWVGPVIREYLVSEAMAALGIPTTRALAAVATGEAVVRETGPMPGAVLTRVAASHLRVGTFQYFAARRDRDALEDLAAHAIARHYPEAGDALGLLRGAIARQAELVARWMGVGFVHGVMNTDNTTISGETIDYGPCAFLDAYHPGTVFSAIDQGGRYAFARQPQVMAWNLAQLASALLPLIGETDAAIAEAQAAVDGFAPAFDAAWLRVFAAKIGISAPEDGDRALIARLLALMEAAEADFTTTFRALGGADPEAALAGAGAKEDWARDWRARLSREAGDPDGTMAEANPAVIPRNHRIEAAIEAAIGGDLAPFHALGERLSRPFESLAEDPLAAPPAPEERVTRTFCGT